MSTAEKLLWINKYKPKNFDEIIGNKEAISIFRNWIENFFKGEIKQKAVLLWGPPGVGKTLTVEVAAIEYNAELIQMNASDHRSYDIVKRIAISTSKHASFTSNRKIILVDEIDGIFVNEDKGGLNALIELIEISNFPVIFIANDPWDPQFKPLRDLCLMIEYSKVRSTSIISFLEKICRVEGISCDREALKFIADRCDGDVRSAINDLQLCAAGKKTLKLDDVKWLTYRDRLIPAFNVLRGIFASKTSNSARRYTLTSELSYDELILWLNENIPIQYSNVHELVDAYNALSRADVYIGRIKSSQDWSLLSYAMDMMTAGVALAKREKYKFVKYTFPDRIRVLQKTMKTREIMNNIAKSIAKNCHVSSKTAIADYIPILKIIFNNNVEMAAGIAKWLDLDDDMIAFLAESPDKSEKIKSLIKR
ncbi:MAG: replication factor C large subunit [Candidatus Methanomethylicia archaeon]|nr:replication factor C large subunit [Candidatus Methanomethylicia archaeon]MCX8168981.1 replication factor C large subunit [Candidatus Methanomethylicia archaeon]MDW7988713.1 replication factor C large subunit [Nitrososphaerota archaeon]